MIYIIVLALLFDIIVLLAQPNMRPQHSTLESVFIFLGLVQSIWAIAQLFTLVFYMRWFFLKHTGATTALAMGLVSIPVTNTMNATTANIVPSPTAFSSIVPWLGLAIALLGAASLLYAIVVQHDDPFKLPESPLRAYRWRRRGPFYVIDRMPSKPEM